MVTVRSPTISLSCNALLMSELKSLMLLKKLLTPVRIATRNYDGVTVARLALDRGFLDQIPESARPKTMGPFRRFLHKIASSEAPF